MKTKKLTLAAVLLAVGIVTSCEEKTADVSPHGTSGTSIISTDSSTSVIGVDSTSIVGKWKWVGTWLVIPLSETNPATPENTGVEKQLVLNTDFTWYNAQNNALIDSGSYSLGHGSYTSPAGDYSHTYNSINYYRNGIYVRTDYYEIHNDTLMFDGHFAGLVGGAMEQWNRAK